MAKTRRRFSASLAITGQTQQVDMNVNLGEIKQFIVATDQTSEQSFTLTLINEKSDIVYGPRDFSITAASPLNDLHPELLPVGVLTVKVTDPVPATGTFAIAALVEV